jgi:hypothetical protein
MDFSLEHFLEWCRVAPCPILAPFFWRKGGIPQNLLHTNYENALEIVSKMALQVPIAILQGLKPSVLWPFPARLKSCPDTIAAFETRSRKNPL